MRVILFRVSAFLCCFATLGCGGYQPLSSIEHISPSLWSELQADEDGRAVIILPNGSPPAE